MRCCSLAAPQARRVNTKVAATEGGGVRPQLQDEDDDDISYSYSDARSEDSRDIELLEDDEVEPVNGRPPAGEPRQVMGADADKPAEANGGGAAVTESVRSSAVEAEAWSKFETLTGNVADLLCVAMWVTGRRSRVWWRMGWRVG